MHTCAKPVRCPVGADDTSTCTVGLFCLGYPSARQRKPSRHCASLSLPNDPYLYLQALIKRTVPLHQYGW